MPKDVVSQKKFVPLQPEISKANSFNMCSLEQLKYNLLTLTDGEQPIDVVVGDDFFSAIPDSIVGGGSVHVSGSIRKAVGFYELQLHIEGTVRVPCDRCLDLMDQPVTGDLSQQVHIGQSDGSEADGDDAVTVSEREPVLDISWPVYEATVLAIPIQHVHQPGDCNDAMMRVLSEHSAARSSDADADTDIDPRWAKLRELKE